MESLLVYYEGNKNEFLEKKMIHLCESYQGQTIQEFSFGNGVREAIFSFKTKEQETNFRKDVLIASKPFADITVNFGGALFLV